MSASVEMRMPLLDVVFYLLDSIRSPQDFTLIFHFRNPPDAGGLQAGARSAMNRFAKNGCCIERQKWVWCDRHFELDRISTIEEFIDEPFDLRHQPPVKQSLISDGSGTRLVTRFHHAAADGLSAALWLGHQLNVAYGLEAVERERAPFAEVTLRRLSTSVRRSQFAFSGVSDPLLISPSKPSGSRHWLTISFPASDLQKACRRAGGFTYSDLLATCTLEVFCNLLGVRRLAAALAFDQASSRTKRRQAAALQEDANRNIGLWVPMNIRRESTAGFGNGTSRIRLYARYSSRASLVEKCREVRRQVSWTSKHGEWVVSDISWLTRLPHSITRPLLRGYLNLPSVDMATGVFSHASSWIANTGEVFKHVEKIECVGLFHPRQNLAINAATHCGQTWLTFTYDRQLFTIDDIRHLTQMYEDQIALAQRELL